MGAAVDGDKGFTGALKHTAFLNFRAGPRRCFYKYRREVARRAQQLFVFRRPDGRCALAGLSFGARRARVDVFPQTTVPPHLPPPPSSAQRVETFGSSGKTINNISICTTEEIGRRRKCSYLEQNIVCAYTGRFWKRAFCDVMKGDCTV